MFLSADELKLTYGVDMRIAKAYVDRPVPAENAYWKDRHLYIPPVTGFLFMPIFSDLLRRLGIPITDILSEGYFQLAEAILDSAARLEMGKLSWAGHVDECLQVASSSCSNPELLSDLRHYLKGEPALSAIQLGTGFPSLNRADTYLLSLCCISFDKSMRIKVCQAWYSLMIYFLALDDLKDIEDDLRDQEENVLIDAGLSEEGAIKVEKLIEDSHHQMEQINPVMANRMDHKRGKMDIRALVQSIVQGT